MQAVEDRLVQVLRNLIGNAQSFSPAGGRIALSARAAGAMVEISVEDDGPGMPEPGSSTSSTASTPSGRMASGSGGIPGWGCRSAGRSSRR